MGKRTEWTDERIRDYVEHSNGHLATAAKNMNADFPRQPNPRWNNRSPTTSGAPPNDSSYAGGSALVLS